MSSHLYLPFIVITEGRSGTTLLRDLISCHPHAFCDGEILNREKDISLILGRGYKLSSYLSYGFKCRVIALENLSSSDQVIQKFIQEGWKIISLRRENILRHAISYFVGSRLHEETGAWHLGTWGLGQKSNQANVPKIHIDPNELLQRMSWLSNIWKKQDYILSKIDYLSLIYEDDLLYQSTHQQTANRCFKYLGLPEYYAISGMKRVVQDDLSLVVKNLEEILESVENSRYSKYLSQQDDNHIIF